MAETTVQVRLRARMKILFLDDDKTRHESFRTKSKNWPHDITYVWTAYKAIRALEKEYFHEVFLDHDLGPQQEMNLPDTGEGSGYDVALFIATMSRDKRPISVIIHSWNPAGADRMASALRKAEEEGMTLAKIPFSYK